MACILILRCFCVVWLKRRELPLPDSIVAGPCDVPGIGDITLSDDQFQILDAGDERSWIQFFLCKLGDHI